jgi:hypothetical protein
MSRTKADLTFLKDKNQLPVLAWQVMGLKNHTDINTHCCGSVPGKSRNPYQASQMHR